jgi:hypothetical protein
MLISVEKPIGRFFSQPYELKRYLVSYSQNLGENELLSGVSFVIDTTTVPPFTVTNAAIAPDGKQITFFAGEGLTGTTYKVSVRVTTNAGQRFEDEIQFEVSER